MEISLDLELNGDPLFKGMELSTSNLSVLVGVNNSGKTLIMKTVWFATHMLQQFKIILMTQPKEGALKKLHEAVETFFPMTFTSPEMFSGYFQIKEEPDYVFQMKFNQGELEWVNVDILRPGAFSVKEIQSVQFASRNTRTFTSFRQYKKLSKMFNIDFLRGKGEEKDLAKLAEFFPLYDIMWFEDIKNKLLRLANDPSRIPLDRLEAFQLSIMESKDITSIYFDEEGLPGFVYADGTKKLFESFSSGAQAIMMLTLFN
jgi:hypothetical protein